MAYLLIVGRLFFFMLGGEKRLELTVETILQKISEYDIYKMYYPGNLELDKKIKSYMPTREDSSPSFFVSNKNGFMYHIDYGDSRFRGNCIQFVMQMFSLNFDGALRKIDRDFGLGISTNYKVGNYEKITSKYEQPALKEKRAKFFQVKTKRFSKEELDWWAQYHITLDELKKFHVYSVKEYYIDKIKIAIPNNEMVFGYLYDNKYWKIYRPQCKEPENKWRTNCPIDFVEGLEELKSCENAIVTKSKKDLIVLRKITPCVCAVQNESVVALNAETISHLKKNCANVFINYDGDAPGKKNSWAVTKEFGFKHVNVPDDLVERGMKDFSDVAKVLGVEYIKNYLQQKNII